MFYDPVRLQLNALNGTGLSFIFSGLAFKGTLGRVPAHICFDSGATDVFLSQAFVQRSGMKVVPCRRTVTMADGQTADIDGMCCLKIKIEV